MVLQQAEGCIFYVLSVCYVVVGSNIGFLIFSYFKSSDLCKYEYRHKSDGDVFQA